MGVYDRQIATAKRLIAASGQSVTWRQLSETTPDDAKPWNAANGAPLNHSVSIVFLPINRVNQQLIHALRGTEVPVGILQGLMGAVSFVPSIKDTVIRNGITYNISSIDPIAPNGDVILYTIEFLV